jgi:HD superfamily phosphohydrolase
MNSVIVKEYLWAPDGFLITDSRLIELLNSRTIERLSGIGQNGPFNHIASPSGKLSNVNRYMHSVGAMVLTLIVGGTVEEAIVALLHDIMHTAFSHAFDFVANSSAVSYHEKHKNRLLEQFKNELSCILGNDWRKFLNEENWPLIKKNNPFAIDIADYIVRDSVAVDLCNIDDARKMVKNLEVTEIDCIRQLICKDIKTSEWWSDLSEKVNRLYYISPWNVAMNHYLANSLKEAIDVGKLTLEELETANNKNIEKDALDIVFEMKSGRILKNVTNYEWDFFEENRELGSCWKYVGSFDIRNRIVRPPIKDIPYTSIDTVIKRYKLAYIE